MERAHALPAHALPTKFACFASPLSMQMPDGCDTSVTSSWMHMATYNDTPRFAEVFERLLLHPMLVTHSLEWEKKLHALLLLYYFIFFPLLAASLL